MEGQDIHTTEAVIDNGSFGTRTIRFETGRLARQAAGSVAAYLDETGEPATLAALSRELGIPNGSLYNRWFRLKANRAGVHFARHGRTTYASREVQPWSSPPSRPRVRVAPVRR